MNKLLLGVALAIVLAASVLADCGDNRINGNELCDGADLGGNVCGSLNYTYGKLGCKDNCTFDLSGCFNVAGSNCADVFRGNFSANCTQDGRGGYECLQGKNGTSALNFCELSEGMVLKNFDGGVYLSRGIPFEVHSYKAAEISYSLDGKKFRKVCDSCSDFLKDMNFRYGPHNLLVIAEYPNGKISQDFAWFAIERPKVEKDGMIFWYGEAPVHSFSQGYSEFRKVMTTNEDNFDELVVTKIQIAAKNLPKIQSDEEYGVWLTKSGSTDFRKLGLLNVNRKTSLNPLLTGIIGFYRQSWYDEDVLDGFDGALIDIEPQNYDLPYPTGETALWFNNEPNTRYVAKNESCINGVQCVSGYCANGLCN